MNEPNSLRGAGVAQDEVKPLNMLLRMPNAGKWVNVRRGRARLSWWGSPQTE